SIRARAFYETKLGLQFVADEDYAVVFNAHGTTLRIQKVPELQAALHTTLGWQVDNIEQTVRELTGRDVTFERYGFLSQDELGIWTTPTGARVAWFKDPDGNTLSLTQG